MISLMKHIELGISEKFYFDYDGQPLPLRPITSWELDDCFYNALRNAPKNVAKFLVEVKLSIIRPNEAVDLTNEGYASLVKYYNEINYWIVYHAMKDFQDELFRYEDEGEPRGISKVRQMKHIHEIAERVFSYSHAPAKAIKEIVKSESGKLLGTLVFYLNEPLTSELWKQTNLQRSFLVYSKGQLMEDANKKKISVSGEKVKMRDFLRSVS